MVFAMPTRKANGDLFDIPLRKVSPERVLLHDASRCRGTLINTAEIGLLAPDELVGTIGEAAYIVVPHRPRERLQQRIDDIQYLPHRMPKRRAVIIDEDSLAIIRQIFKDVIDDKSFSVIRNLMQKEKASNRVIFG